MDSEELNAILNKDHDEPEISAKKFLLKTLLWLPICFTVWYLMAAAFSFPAIKLSDWLLPWVLPGVFDGVEQVGYKVDIVTSLDIRAPSGQLGQFVFSLNALKFGYGFPLLLAMMLATPYSIYKKLDDLVYGLIFVVLAQLWGIVFESLSTLMLRMGNEIVVQVVSILPFTKSEFFLNLIALCYQLGVLVLPALVPIAFWILRHPDLLETMATDSVHRKK